jgi:very-short-patch-repair endonuclease
LAVLNPGRTIKRARELRGQMSLPEVLLWRAIRRKALCDLRFRRQAPMGPYVLDFYCEEVRLAVEVDGDSHNMGDQPERDQRKDEWLATQEIRVLRLPAKVVVKDMDSAVRTIAAWANGKVGSLEPPSPASRGLPPKGEDLGRR